MSYVSKMLLPDEHVVYMGTLHWIVFMPGMFLTLLGGIVGYYSYAIVGFIVGSSLGPPVAQTIGRGLAGLAMILAALGFGLLLGAAIRQSATELAITNRRLIAKYGFISRMTSEIMINRVTGVNFEQTVLGRIFGYGTILVHGQGGDVSPFDVVSDPQGFTHAIMRVLESGGKS
jgi:uncharacterized membrane protein YdbT with pleckstrin-like domain